MLIDSNSVQYFSDQAASLDPGVFTKQDIASYYTIDSVVYPVFDTNTIWNTYDTNTPYVLIDNTTNLQYAYPSLIPPSTDQTQNTFTYMHTSGHYTVSGTVYGIPYASGSNIWDLYPATSSLYMFVDNTGINWISSLSSTLTVPTTESTNKTFTYQDISAYYTFAMNGSNYNVGSSGTDPTSNVSNYFQYVLSTTLTGGSVTDPNNGDAIVGGNSTLDLSGLISGNTYNISI
jgi:hypothetical protein